MPSPKGAGFRRSAWGASPLRHGVDSHHVPLPGPGSEPRYLGNDGLRRAGQDHAREQHAGETGQWLRARSSVRSWVGYRSASAWVVRGEGIQTSASESLG